MKTESGGKCAYCEADTQTVAYGDVEHFRREELRRKRGWVLRKLSLFKDVLETDAVDEELHSETLSVILEMMSHTAPFAGMVRYFVREVWQLQLDE